MLLKGRYRVGELLVEGGMGIVYRGRDELLDRDVAIKTFRDAPDRQALGLFEKEWRVLAKINHPNVIEIYDIAELEHEGVSKPFFVMPLLSGCNLAQLIKECPDGISIKRAAGIIAQVCLGLDAAHSSSVVHRDVKPGNIFVLQDDTVKLIDFGVVRLVTGTTVTRLGRHEMLLERESGEPRQVGWVNKRYLEIVQANGQAR
jgi:serine/threonine-protein kinase